MAEESQTLTMDETQAESGEFTPEEMDSLKVGEQMAAAQDPVVQQQQAELQLKQAELQQKAQEAQLEASTDIEKTKMRNQLEYDRLDQQKEIAEDKLAIEIMKAKK